MRNIIQIKSSKEQCERKDFAQNERIYLRNSEVNMVALLSSVASLVVLADMHSKLNCAHVDKDIVIFSGFSYHPVYIALYNSITNIKATSLDTSC